MSIANGVGTGATKGSATIKSTVDADVRIDRDARLVSGGSLTTEAWGRQWLLLRASDGIRSLKDDRNRWKTHVLCEWWATEILLSDVSPMIAREWFAALCTKLTATPKWKVRRPLSASTIKNTLNLVRCAFQAAVDVGLIPINPFQPLKLSRSRSARTKKPVRVLRLPEQEIARAIVPSVERPIADVALWSCIRQGEQWSLRLDDVDLSENDPHFVIRFGGVQATRPDSGTFVEIGGLFFLPTKSGEPRKVQLFGRALDGMRRWVANLSTYAPNNPHRLAFPLRCGRHRRKGYLPYWFRKIVATLGKMRWHDWRHTGATSMLGGWWKVLWRKEELQLFLGHSSVTTTERYARWLEGEENGLASVVAEMRGLAKTTATVPVLHVEEHMQSSGEGVVTNGVAMTTGETSDADLRRGSDSNRRKTVLQTDGVRNTPQGGEHGLGAESPEDVEERLTKPSRKARGARKMPAQKPGKSKQDYGTPWVLIRAIEARFGAIVVDLAASPENAKASVFVTKEEDTFKLNWSERFPTGNAFLNPEFSDIAPYVAKCATEQARRPNGKIIVLVPAAVGSEWFASHVMGKAKVIPLRPRIPFDGCPINPKTGKVDGYIKDCMLLVYGEPPGFEPWRWDANVQPGAIINVGEVSKPPKRPAAARVRPENGHGAADGFGGTDFPDVDECAPDMATAAAAVAARDAGRTTDDGTYPDVDEHTARNAERLSPVVHERALGAAPLVFVVGDHVRVINGRFRGEEGEITAEGVAPSTGRKVFSVRIGGSEISPFLPGDLDIVATKTEREAWDRQRATPPLPADASARDRARRNLVDLAQIAKTAVGSAALGVRAGDASKAVHALAERAVTLADIWIADAKEAARLRADNEDLRERLRMATGLLHDTSAPLAAIDAFLDREVTR